MSTTILLIRHGETAWNRRRVFRGTYDVPLNDNGREQAGLVGKALQEFRIGAAYTSPLARARETAEIALSGQDISPSVAAGLTDFDYGDWTGLTEVEVSGKWPQEHSAWVSRPETLRVPGGSTLREVYDASYAAMERAALKHPSQTVVLFAHRVVNKLLALGALGLGLDRFGFIRQDNCCLNEFVRREDGYVICRLNDTSHLRHAGIDVLNADF
jgi:broad specificity phosphatase PhoE